MQLQEANTDEAGHTEEDQARQAGQSTKIHSRIVYMLLGVELAVAGVSAQLVAGGVLGVAGAGAGAVAGPGVGVVPAAAKQKLVEHPDAAYAGEAAGKLDRGPALAPGPPRPA